MAVMIKSVNDLKSKLTKPPICEYVKENLNDILNELDEAITTIYSTDGNVLLDRKCVIRFIPIDTIQEYIFYEGLKDSMDKSYPLIITDDAKNRADNIVSGAKRYLNIKMEINKVNNNNTSIIILEFQDGETDIYFGLMSYVKKFLNVK